MAQADPTLLDKIEALRVRAFDEFSRQALEGARHALMDRDNPRRLNFFSTATRILFEHMTDAMSPNDLVAQCSWFKSERENGQPTRGQRIVFAIQGGLSDTFVRQSLQVDPLPLRKRLLETIDELSKHVHGRESTIIHDPVEQDTAAETTITAMTSFFDAVHPFVAVMESTHLRQCDNPPKLRRLHQTGLWAARERGREEELSCPRRYEPEPQNARFSAADRIFGRHKSPELRIRCCDLAEP